MGSTEFTGRYRRALVQISGASYMLAGGSYYYLPYNAGTGGYNPGRRTGPSITISGLAACGITGVTGLTQTGANTNGNFDAASYIGFRFRGTEGANTYDYVYEIAGVTGTTYTASRTPVSTSNTPPTAEAGNAQTVASGAEVTLTSAGSNANDVGQGLTYQWTAPRGISLSSSTAQMPTFDAPTLRIGDRDVELEFSLVVNDTVENSAADTVVITVEAPRDSEAPVIAPLQAVTLEAGPRGTGSHTFSATATDNYDKVVRPVFTLGGNGITSPYDFPVGANQVLVNAQDAAGNNAVQQTLVVTVTAVVAPATPVISTAVINANRSMTITGTAEAGSTVRVFFADRSYRDVTATGGAFSVTSSANMRGGRISVLAMDAQDNASGRVTVDLFPDYVGPTVTIAGAPTRVVDETPFTMTVTFSETVTGFASGDFDVTGATVTAVNGRGADYTAEITPIAGEAISISVRDGAAQDAFTNQNTASNVVTIDNAALTETEEMITEVAGSRNRALIATQPNISRFMLGGQSGSFNADVTQGAGNFNFTTSSDRPVWTAGQGRRTTEGTLESSYANLAMGAHYGLNDNILVGAMAQFDTFTSDKGAARFKGTGWLVGPYGVARLSEQPLVFSASYLMGQTDNKISPLGTYEDSFRSDRSIFTLGVVGEVELTRLTLIPLLDFVQATEENESYIGGDTVAVRSQKVTTTETTLGLDFVMPLDVANGGFGLLGGLAATSSLTDNGVEKTDATRGRTELGFRYTMESGGRLTGRVTYDGIGQGDYEALGAELMFDLKF